MKDGKKPDPNVVHPIRGYDKEIHVRPTITNPNIIVGEFCQIAAGVEFVMNGANHINFHLFANSIRTLQLRSPNQK